MKYEMRNRDDRTRIVKGTVIQTETGLKCCIVAGELVQALLQFLLVLVVKWQRYNIFKNEKCFLTKTLV